MRLYSQKGSECNSKCDICRTPVEKQQASVVVQDGVSIEDVKSAIVNAGKKVNGERTIVDGVAEEIA